MNTARTKKDQAAATNVRENSFGWLIRKISAGMDRDMTAALKPHGLNLGQFAILMTLLEKDEITQSDIGKKISMPGYATTRNIDVLENHGLLERQKHEASRRSFSIRLTEKGKSIAPVLFSIVKNINEGALASLDENETQVLKQLLSKCCY